jgi:hypothetical protein
MPRARNEGGGGRKKSVRAQKNAVGDGADTLLTAETAPPSADASVNADANGNAKDNAANADASPAAVQPASSVQVSLTVRPRLPDARSRGSDLHTLSESLMPVILGSGALEHPREVARKEIVMSTARPHRSAYMGVATHENAASIAPRDMAEWPRSTTSLCWHCAEPCPSIPLPAIKYRDTRSGKYCVFGIFCRPCCSLGYLMDHHTYETARQISWTREVLDRYFGCSLPRAAPPPTCLQKYGGPMSLEQFYGEDAHKTCYLTTISPPFVSFFMLMEYLQTGGGEPSATVQSADDPMDEQDGVILRRPRVRAEPVAAQEPIGKVPLLLSFLVEKAREMREGGARPIEPLRAAENVKLAGKKRRAEQSLL